LNQTQAGELVLGGLNFATGDNITLGADLSAAGQGTHLTTSLKDLQKLGVDAVAISGDADGNAATVNSINLDLGSSGALSAGGLPVFGNTDGVAGLTLAEDNALNVTLNVADAAQLGQVGALNANVLSNLGIDNVQINLAESNDLGTDYNQELTNLLAGTRSFLMTPSGRSLHTRVTNSKSSLRMPSDQIFVVFSTFSLSALSRSQGRRLRSSLALPM
jgi:hypothetical protein